MERVAKLQKHLHAYDGLGRNEDYVDIRVDMASGMGLLIMKPFPFQQRALPHSGHPHYMAHERRDGAGLDTVLSDKSFLDRDNSPGSLSAVMRRALVQGLAHLQSDPTCRFVAFVSTSPHVFSLGVNTFNVEEAVQARPTVEDLCEAIVRSTKPTISVIYGKCFSWGLEMALCTTYRVAAQSRSWLSFPEVRLAMSPASVLGVQAAIRRAGVRTTVRLFCSGEVLEASRAREVGLVDAVWIAPEGSAPGQPVSKTYGAALQSEFVAFASAFMQERIREAERSDNGKEGSDPNRQGVTPAALDRVAASLIPLPAGQKPPRLGQVLAEFPADAVLWSQIRMFCAWAAHVVSISPLPRRYRSPYYLIESLRIATIRFSPREYCKQCTHMQAAFLKCARLPECLAVRHAYSCIQRQMRWTPIGQRSAATELPRALLIPSSADLQNVLHAAAASGTAQWTLPPRIHSISIVAEDNAAAAFVAATLLHARPGVEVIILCLRPYQGGRSHAPSSNTAYASSDSRSFPGAGQRSGSTSSSTSSSSADSDAGAIVAYSPLGAHRRHKSVAAHQERFCRLEELRSTVLDYIWLFRGVTQPGNGPDSPAGAALREAISTQLRILDVHREHAEDGWHNVPPRFYQADFLFECCYPWTTGTTASFYEHSASPSMAHLTDTSRDAGVVQQQRLRRWSFLDAHMQINCIFVCTTAASNMNALTQVVSRHRDRVLGAFFAPRLQNEAGVIEICHTPHLSSAVLRYTQYFFQQVGCYTTVVRSPVCGYVLCRLLFAGLYQAHSMLLDGCFPAELERAMRRRFHCKGGLLMLEDLWGLDWCAVVRQCVSAADLPRRKVHHIPYRMIAQERVGRRTGEGWFRYEKLKGREYYERNPQHLPSSATEYAAASNALRRAGVMKLLRRRQRKPLPSSVLPLYAWPSTVIHYNRAVELEYVSFCRQTKLMRRDVTEMEMTERMCLPMVNEAVRLLSDGVVESSKDIDLLSIYGLGFPVFTGGLLFDTDQTGDPKSLLHKMHIYRFALGGEIFPSPCRALTQMASDDKPIHTEFP
eukprot:gene10568-7338_t